VYALESWFALRFPAAALPLESLRECYEALVLWSFYKLLLSWLEEEGVERREALELMRREAIYRGNRSPIQVEGRIVILIDDGIATGSTMRVAIQLLRAQHVQKIIVATPAAPPSAKWEIEPLVDEFIAVVLPPDFYGVGQFYEDFAQMDDDTIYELVQMGAKIEPVGAL
jgi:predicted phosphoribosyltransferase